MVGGVVADLEFGGVKCCCYLVIFCVFLARLALVYLFSGLYMGRTGLQTFSLMVSSNGVLEVAIVRRNGVIVRRPGRKWCRAWSLLRDIWDG